MSKSSPAKTPPPRQSRSQAIDDLIMGTNSSSIVSKRSVERLYHPNEAHFFRYFVNKFQRRAPLINRGYWLRLRAIDAVVHQFLKSAPAGRKKVIINLGCGSDVLPWQCHHRYPDACENTTFVDVDYPDLIRKKRSIVLGTPALRDLLGPNPTVSEKDTDQILLGSDKYYQLGCDLRKLDAFRQCLESFLPLSDCSVLFVAEVSITYMDTKSADDLIEWASSIGHAEFCLLEQIIPNGADHPFAKTMLRHFNKLNTSLKSVHQYPTLDCQRVRFQERGWNQIDLWDLWEAWNDDMFLTSTERMEIDEVEPFDEWEEFILFARHYFVLHAKAASKSSSGSNARAEMNPTRVPHADLGITCSTTTAPKRRFGAPMVIANPEGQQYAIHTFGLGSSGRVPSCDLFTLQETSVPMELSPVGPSERMCHTLTDLGSFGILLAGGRGSPTRVLSDCWIFKRDTRSWNKVDDLPTPLFRHCAIRLKDSGLALVFGGKTGTSQVSPNYFLFHPAQGWLQCKTSGNVPDSIFGAVAFALQQELDRNTGVFSGILSGGITQTGVINSKIYRWTIDITSHSPSLHFEATQELGHQGNVLSIFGAQVVEGESFTSICGGVGWAASSLGQDVAFVTVSGDLDVALSSPSKTATSKWPLMIGCSAMFLGGTLCLVGGGATCFSMGTFWETGIYTIDTSSIFPELLQRRKTHERNIIIQYQDSPRLSHYPVAVSEVRKGTTKLQMNTIPRVSLNKESSFQDILRKRKPVIIEGLDLGGCVENWTPENMVQRLGYTKEIVVHECQMDTDKMDFNSKNFRYVTETIGAFMDKASQGQRLYLRSLSERKPSESPANVEEDFPALAEDCRLPDELSYIRDNLFSSVLRISGKVNMWLHYDVMANVYAQIRGSKRMVLFPPTDVSHLAFAPGASSSSLDVFSALEKHQLAGTHPHEALLKPGDVLFLPAMWFHTAAPTTNMSVAVNFFFRDLESGYSAGRDVYGNRDLAAYEKGRQEVARIAKGFGHLPTEIRQFYLARLADELLNEQVQ
ncbi:hypothetical protein BGZ63DRAFT_427960 [Mariannaea sp. PMI_226]|nr:hypothetical protein BGZ63DRAFT_427960 [Mariannaea sp. PMI_226]